MLSHRKQQRRLRWRKLLVVFLRLDELCLAQPELCAPEDPTPIVSKDDAVGWNHDIHWTLRNCGNQRGVSRIESESGPLCQYDSRSFDRTLYANESYNFVLTFTSDTYTPPNDKCVYDVLVNGVLKATETVQWPTLSLIPTTMSTPTKTNRPSYAPSLPPTTTPTESPSPTTTTTPTEAPTPTATNSPSEAPSFTPTTTPTEAPSSTPTSTPTEAQSSSPTSAPTEAPSYTPSSTPSEAPTSTPTSVGVSAATSASSPLQVPTLAPTFAAVPLPSTPQNGSAPTASNDDAVKIGIIVVSSLLVAMCFAGITCYIYKKKCSKSDCKLPAQKDANAEAAKVSPLVIEENKDHENGVGADLLVAHEVGIDAEQIPAPEDSLVVELPAALNDGADVELRDDVAQPSPGSPPGSPSKAASLV